LVHFQRATLAFIISNMSAHRACYARRWAMSGWSAGKAAWSKGHLMNNSKTAVNSRMSDALEICNSLDQAAQSLSLREEERWPAWMRYFLGALEQQATSPAAYQEFLECLRADIANRLRRESW
jgi:aminoglycoside phosphotransferase (APT) family kinase protein